MSATIEKKKPDIFSQLMLVVSKVPYNGRESYIVAEYVAEFEGLVVIKDIRPEPFEDKTQWEVPKKSVKQWPQRGQLPSLKKGDTVYSQWWCPDVEPGFSSMFYKAKVIEADENTGRVDVVFEGESAVVPIPRDKMFIE
ncbi:hypothetical protein GEMRC1_002591 [Eukaryota sp. GEM-RC1]